MLVHADSGGYKPLNWMTPPTVIEEEPGLIVVRKRAGKTEDRLEIRISEVLSDFEQPMDEASGLAKDGVERDLQEALAERPDWLEEELRLVRREWSTEVGPVDLMCRDCDDGWVAVEIKRLGTIEAVEQLTRYLGFIRVDPAKERCRGILAAQRFKPQAVDARRVARDPLRRGRSRASARRARAGADALRLVPCGHFRDGEAYTTLMVVKVGCPRAAREPAFLPRPRSRLATKSIVTDRGATVARILEPEIGTTQLHARLDP